MVLIVAHRGASHDAPENTIPAFELAFKQGADAIEADFHLTRDGEIVCIHNQTTGKVAGIHKIVKKSTLQQLKQLDVGSWFNSSWQGITIPTLSEVFENIPPDKKLFLEIKSGREIIPKLLSTLKSCSFSPEQLIIISFNTKVIQAVKNQAPFLKTLLLSRFQFNQISQKLIPSVEHVLKKLQLTQADGFSSQAHKLLDESFIDRIKKDGYEYHVWTIDKPEIAQKFVQMGVNSITTNLPGYLRQQLVK